MGGRRFAKRIHRERLFEAQFKVGGRSFQVFLFYAFTSRGRDEVHVFFGVMPQQRENAEGLMQVWMGDESGHIGPGLVVGGVHFGAGRAEQATTAMGKKWA